MDDEKLLTLFNKISTDTINAEKIVNVYLDRARKNKDTLKIARAYVRLIAISESSERLSYSDSIIYLTKNLNSKKYPTVGYILKGIEYYRIGNLKLATENYLDAYKLALKNDDITLQVYISDKLIGLKSYWGNKLEALELQKKRHQLVTKKEYLKGIKSSATERGSTNFENLYFESVLTSMQNFVVCYINLKELDSANFYIKEGIRKVANYKGYNQEYFKNWFAEASMEIDWYAKNYKKAITTSDKLLTTLDNSRPELLIDVYFFKGFSLIKIGKYNEGIEYLKMADSVFTKKNVSLLPYHRDLFEELLAYYMSRDDAEMKIKYLNKLLDVDSIFKRNYQFFEPNLIKNYETPKLLKEKEILITSLKQKNKKSLATNWWLIAFLGASLIAVVYYFKRQLVYKKRFKSLMQAQKFSKLEKVEANLHKNIVSSEITKEILNQLKDFEVQKKFLSQKVSLQSLAKSFGTNHSYLSKVINLEKKKHFTVYISDLRIEYIFEELKKNEKLRKYTIKAIALESGFANAESFSKAFYKKYGIYPSFYIKKLKKTIA